MKSIRILSALCGLLLFHSTVAAQSRAWDPSGLQLTRAELQQLLQRYEETVQSQAYTETLRKNAAAEIDLIRQRLAEGDLRVGDRIMLDVQGHPALSADTFTVVSGRKIVLPQGFGDVPLEGVLRSELQAHMTTHMARFIRDPIVRARSLVRLQMEGAVASPGFYMVPSDVLLSDALMMAGGPVANANMERVQIKRSGDVIWDGDRLAEAIVVGRTLDQLSVRAGDVIDVPQKRSRLDVMRNGLAVVGAVSSLVLLAVRLGVF
jgi:protein involved in polysaccharide export with SLBB domain